MASPHRGSVGDNATNTNSDAKDTQKEDEISVCRGPSQSEHTTDNVPQVQDSDPERTAGATTRSESEAPYCVLREREKTFFMLTSSFAALVSPLSSSIYFPSMNTIAKDLNVSITLMNLTVTMYQVRQ